MINESVELPSELFGDLMYALDRGGVSNLRMDVIKDDTGKITVEFHAAASVELARALRELRGAITQYRVREGTTITLTVKSQP